MYFYEILDQIVKLNKPAGNVSDKSFKNTDQKSTKTIFSDTFSKNSNPQQSAFLEKAEEGIISIYKQEKRGRQELSYEYVWAQLYNQILQDFNKTNSVDVVNTVEKLLQEIKVNLDKVYNRTANFNMEVEKFLLPIVKLAHIYELNGIPEEHAKKLGMVFSNVDDALNYLNLFAKNAIELQRQKFARINGSSANATLRDLPVVHNACLFSVPQAGFNFKTEEWQKLIKENMQNPAFRSLLATAAELKEFINKKVTESSANQVYLKKGSREAKALDQKLHEILGQIQALNKEYKLIRDKKVDPKKIVTLNEERSFKEYPEKLLKKQIELVKVSAALKRNIGQFSFEELNAYMAAYMNEVDAGARYFVENYLTKKNYDAFLKLKRIDDNTRIPEIKIDGKSLGIEGYYLRRLNVENNADAVMAACLGKLSDCCQSLSGEMGEPCAIHGLTSPEGGFYVVCKGDVNNPSNKDELICQSWVWRSKSGALVIDSVESKQYSLSVENIVRTFYYELAYQLVTEHQIPKVCYGNVSGISSALDTVSSYYISNEHPKDYEGYRDSSSQSMLCDKNELYLFYGKEEDFFSGTYQDEAFTGPTDLKFIKMINFAIENNRIDLLDRYCSLFPEYGALIIGECESFWELLNYEINIEQFEEILRHLMESPYLLHMKNYNKDTILHLAYADPESLNQILICLSKDNIIEAVKEEHINGNNLLHLAVKFPESLEQILKYLPEEMIVETIKVKNVDGDNILHLAASIPESLEQILKYLSEEMISEAVKVKNVDGDNILHLAAGIPESLEQILEHLSKDMVLELVKEKNVNGDNVLHIAYYKPESLNQILSHLPKEMLLEVVREKNIDGYSVLCLCLEGRVPKALKQILDHLLEEDMRAVIEEMQHSYPSLMKELQILINKDKEVNTAKPIIFLSTHNQPEEIKHCNSTNSADQTPRSSSFNQG